MPLNLLLVMVMRIALLLNKFVMGIGDENCLTFKTYVWYFSVRINLLILCVIV